MDELSFEKPKSYTSTIVISILVILVIIFVITTGVFVDKSNKLDSKLKEIETELKTKSDDLVKKTKEYDDLVKSSGATTKEFSDASKALEEKKKEIDKLTTDLASATTSLTTTKTGLDDATKELNIKKEELKTLYENLKNKDSLVVKIAEKDAEIIKLKADIASLGSKIDNYKTFVKTLTGNLNNAGLTSKTVSDEITNYSTVLDAVDSVLKAKDKTISDLTAASGSKNTTDSAALTRLITDNGSFIEVEKKIAGLNTDKKTLTDTINNMVTIINNTLSNIPVSTDTDGKVFIPTGSVIVDNKVVNLDAHKEYISVTRKLIESIIEKIDPAVPAEKKYNKKIVDQNGNKNFSEYKSMNDVMTLVNAYQTQIKEAEDNYKKQISDLQNRLRFYTKSGANIPVDYLQDTILLGMDSSANRPNQYIDGINYGSLDGFQLEVRNQAGYVCNNLPSCSSYTTARSLTEEYPFGYPAYHGNLNDDNNSEIKDSCGATNKNDVVIDVQFASVRNKGSTEEKDWAPLNADVKSFLLGRSTFKLKDLVPNSTGKEYQLGYYCGKTAKTYLNSGQEGNMKMSKSNVTPNTTYNVGVVRPDMMNWSTYGHDPTYNTVDFSKLNTSGTGASGVVFNKTELYGKQLGMKAVKNLQECVSYLNETKTNNPNNTGNYAAIINRVGLDINSPGNKYNCMIRTDNSATDKLTLARRGSTTKAYYDVYVPPGIVPEFDF